MSAPEAAPLDGLRRRPTVVIVALCYVALTAVFWGTYVLDRGLPAETIVIELSQDRPWWRGFLYPHDSSRRFLSLPFHVAYLLSDGSYLSLHVLFGVLVFLTGLLTYLLVRRLAPRAELVAVLAGAIALTHGADMSVTWVPMIVVRHAIVMILLAAWLLRIGWERDRWWTVPAFAAAQALSLWTYEAGLVLLLTGPVLIWRPGVSWRRFATWSAMWLAVPASSAASLVHRYVIAHEVSYQSARIAADLSVGAATTMLGGLVYHGLAFWAWPVYWWTIVFEGCAGAVHARTAVPLALGLVVFIGCALLLRRRLPADAGPWAVPAVVAAVFLLAAYVPFVPVGGGNWRTHFYAAPAAAVLLALAAVWLDARLRAGRVLAIVVVTLIVGTGLAVGLLSQVQASWGWAMHRRVVTGIVEAAPRLKDDTLVVLVGVPARHSRSACDPRPRTDPFMDTMWFNSAVQVLYPRSRLVGLYWRQDGSSPGSIRFTFDARGATLEKTTIEVEATRFGYDQMIAFRYDHRSGSTLLSRFPADDIPGAVASADYRPEARILPGPPPRETLRKLAR